MTNKIKKYMDLSANILDFIIKIYVIGVIALLMYDYSVHPEMYNVVNERPVRSEIEGNLSFNENNTLESEIFRIDHQPNQVIPEYMYEASTMEECKPLKRIHEFYLTYLQPLFFLIVVTSLLHIIIWIGNSKFIKKI